MEKEKRKRRERGEEEKGRREKGKKKRRGERGERRRTRREEERKKKKKVGEENKKREERETIREGKKKKNEEDEDKGEEVDEKKRTKKQNRNKNVGVEVVGSSWVVDVIPIVDKNGIGFVCHVDECGTDLDWVAPFANIRIRISRVDQLILLNDVFPTVVFEVLDVQNLGVRVVVHTDN